MASCGPLQAPQGPARRPRLRVARRHSKSRRSPPKTQSQQGEKRQIENQGSKQAGDIADEDQQAANCGETHEYHVALLKTDLGAGPSGESPDCGRSRSAAFVKMEGLSGDGIGPDSCDACPASCSGS